MKLGSLFSGSGGFELGGLISGITPVWASEIEPFPIRVTSKRFPNIKHLGDISKVKGDEIEPVDVFTFGSPCQDLSVAGKRAGLKHESIGDEETTRSGLFMEAVRIIKEMRCKTNGEYPTFAVWENVPGAYSSNKGEDFRAVLEELCKIKEESVSIPKPAKWLYAGEILGDGYSIAWRTLDAQYWGVPQRRRRIYLVADFRGERASKVLFEREGLRRDFMQGGTQGQGITTDVEGGIGTADCSIPYTLKIRSGVAVDSYGKAVGTGIIDNIGGQAEYGYNSEVNGTLRAGAQGAVFYAVENHPADSRVNIDDSGKCQTLTSRMGTGGGGECYVMATQQGGAEIAKNLCPTITAAAGMSGNNQPVICLQGNGINRADTAGYNGKGWKEDTSYTLNTIDRPAVAYPQQAYDKFIEDEIGTTLKASGGVYGGGSETLVAEVQLASGKDVAGCLMASGYEKLGAQEMFSGDYTVIEKPQYIVRRLTPTECCRLQGFPDWWCDGLETPEPTEEDLIFWREVFETHRKIVTGASKPKSDKQIIKWLKDPHSDSAEYKLWGNGVALPNTAYVLQGIADELRGECDV